MYLIPILCPNLFQHHKENEIITLRCLDSSLTKPPACAAAVSQAEFTSTALEIFDK